MSAKEITTLVAERASRFGDRNPQQFEQLLARLKKAPEVEVAKGLIRVFTDGQPPPAGSASQELAGALLASLLPNAELDLMSVLRASLPRYELSVEQLPQYLSHKFGQSEVLAALEMIEQEALPESEQRALETMRFWLGGRRKNAVRNNV